MKNTKLLQQYVKYDLYLIFFLIGGVLSLSVVKIVFALLFTYLI